MRAAFETYLTFQFIFVQPTSVEERKFRHTVWVLGGLLDRQRFTTTTPEGKTKLQEERRRSTACARASCPAQYTRNYLSQGARKRKQVNGALENSGWILLSCLERIGSILFLCTHT